MVYLKNNAGSHQCVYKPKRILIYINLQWMDTLSSIYLESPNNRL